jgi:hypothetical protein
MSSLLRRLSGTNRRWVRRLTRPYPLYGWTSEAREEILWLAFTYVRYSRLIGEYAEFGVWRGDTFATAYYLAQHISRKKVERRW